MIFFASQKDIVANDRNTDDADESDEHGFFTHYILPLLEMIFCFAKKDLGDDRNAEDADDTD